MTDPSIPEEFLPVYNDALDYYPHLRGNQGRSYPPFGYHTTDSGSWACDGRRLHVDGELPSDYWAQVLELEIHEYGYISIWFSDCFRPAPGDSEPSALVSLDRLDERIFIHEKSYPENEPPEGFQIRRSYLLGALDFLFRGEDEDHQLEFAVCYNQGVFELFEWDDKTILQGLPRRRCYIAGYLGSQWLLPMNEWLVRLGKRPQSPPARPEVAPRYGSQLEEEVLTTYPFPLACSYLLPLSNRMSAVEEAKALLRAGENLLAYLGSLSLALIPAERRTELNIDPVRMWRGGMGPGNWLQDVSQQCRRLLAAQDHELPKRIARSLREKKGGIYTVLESIVEKKNDFKHDRALSTEGEAEEGNPSLWSQINAAYEDLEYLSLYPVRSIRDSNLDPEDRWFFTTCFVHQGLAMRVEKVKWYEPLPKLHVYVELSPATWVSLHPFIQRLHCPQCGDMEFFYLDRLLDDGNGSMKSFERGHVRVISNVRTSLERWFQGRI